MRRPTRVEPVKLTRRTAGCATMASTTAPASAGALVTKLTVPLGRPASASASMMSACVSGHSSEPLSTTVLPQASGVAMARVARITGAFQGAMPSTTPAACRTPMARLPGTSDGMTSPAICVVSDAASVRMPAARCTLKPAHSAEAPVSRAMACTKASARASSACAALSSRARRSLGPVCDQVAKARCAASTAAIASAGVAAGARVAMPPSSGLRRSKVAPPVAARRSPSMSMEMSVMGGCPLQERGRGVFRPRPGRPGARRRNAAAPALRPRRRRARVRARSRGRRPARPCARSVRP
ncbi:hypothetical protein BKP43_40870 [Variovorax boronicumulans]|nr:hypothetical protein BKP43_40870 [Variovorax boronicumulans]